MAVQTALRKATSKAHPQSIAETDTIGISGLARTASGAATMFTDAFTTTITIGGGASQTGTTIGKSGQTTTFLGHVDIDGNLEIGGTVTVTSTNNLLVTDAAILIRQGAASGDEAAFAVERGATGDDALLLWNEANTRFELGLFDTVGGTSVPTGTLSSFSNLKISNLLLAGTAITADAALTVTATAATLTLAATTTNEIQFTTNSVARWSITSAGHFIADTDNTLDIGATGATRPRTIYVGTSVVVGATIEISSANINGSASTTLTQSAAGTGASGFSWTHSGGAGGVGLAAVGPTAAGTGGTLSVTAGVGGAGDGTDTGGESGGDAGIGGALSLLAGTGGAGQAGTVDPAQPGMGGSVTFAAGAGGAGAGTSTNADGGSMTIRAGAAGTGGGGPAATAGTVTIGATNTSSVRLASGTSTATVIIGNSAAGAVTLDSAAGISLDAATASNFTVSGAAADLTLGARAATITLNESGQTTLSGFTATSIVGALNELKSSGVAEANKVANNYTAAVALNLGSLVYISSQDNVSKAIATADDGLARVAGIAKAAASATATVTIISDGLATVEVDAGTYNINDEVYLSAATAGRVTVTAPSTSGNVVQVIGFVKNNGGVAAKSAGDTLVIILRDAGKIVV